MFYLFAQELGPDYGIPLGAFALLVGIHSVTVIDIICRRWSPVQRLAVSLVLQRIMLCVIIYLPSRVMVL